MDDINLFNDFVSLHRAQLESSEVPQHFWQSLYRKVTAEIFDGGEAFQLMLIEYDSEEVGETDDTRPVFALSIVRESGIKAQDPASVFLIDHAWTFRMDTSRQQLHQYSHLADRLCALTGVDLYDEQRIDKVLRHIWSYCHAYTITSGENLSVEERIPIWYVMDEVGSAVIHSDNPNFRVIPFLFLTTQTTYSLMFPIRDCVYGEQVTRDFVEYVPKDAPERSALLLPWCPINMRDESFVQTEPGEEYFLTSHILESFPIDTLSEPELNRNVPLKVYAEYDVVRQYLTAPDFELVDNEADADVIWLTHHFKEFAEFSRNTPAKFVNQFPFEYLITIKDLLSITCRRAAKEHHNADTLDTYPRWLPTTYNLKTEIVQFVSYYQHRATRGLDNHWIVKPWNLARSMDTHITENIAQIVRLPVTGPKIAQKYIEHPVLFYREEIDAKVKFDVRYIILLKSVEPLEAYVDRKFFLRFANKAFSMDNFDDYEKHFTVMNYQREGDLHHVKCDEFVLNWQEQYPSYPWSDVEDDICNMIHKMLSCATKRDPPCGIAPCPQSRALYAADIMLEWTGTEVKRIQPKLLEVNWTPDCKRACQYYPDFFNNIFKLLFLRESNDDCFRLLQANIDE